MRYLLASLVAVIIFAVPWFVYNYPDETRVFLGAIENVSNQFAAVILSHNPKTIADLQNRYDSATFSSGKKVRILIVPGHEPYFGGAEYGQLLERNLAVELSEDLKQFLGNNPRYQVFVTRDKDAWSSEFANYFKNNWNDIVEWEKAHKNEVIGLVSLGKFKQETPSVLHVDAPNDVAIRIYGIDKWANENDMDVVIHVHFNDYPGHGIVPGKYSGFAIYVPEGQYYNSTTTNAVADTIFKRLAKYNPVSNFPGEKSGIVPDQDLIAVGSYNSVDAASMLIEYSYLYEPQLVNPSTEPIFIKDLAFQTYLGLQDFFDPKSSISLAGAFDTLLLPHTWSAAVADSASSSADVFALQTALLVDGVYPPKDMTKNDCPRTGRIGPCTKTSIESFQKKYGLDGTGIVGPKTIEQLNKLYSVQVR